MKRNIYIKAFTVTELLVTMVIISIVISSALLLWQMAERETLRFEKMASETSRELLFMSTIRTDITNADAITVQNSSIYVIRQGYPTLSYIFANNAVIRNTSFVQNDTISRNTFRLSVMFHPVLKQMVTEVHLRDSVSESVFYKQYTNCQIFNSLIP